MNQYCRYCSHLCAGNGIWCDEKKKELRESTAKSLNHCKAFDFCEIDAFGETDGYKPRHRKKGHQLTEDYSLIETQIQMEV